jgi:glycogen operon protein
MHVDGFRFDLASILNRDGNGNLLSNAPVLERIAKDPVLKDVKIIAESWDAAGTYQVGSFSDRRWVEWNDRFRDEVRRFWRGDDGMLGSFASRICGSADIFSKSGKGPQNSINFITCHDGFTLNDLVSFRGKHNEPNGQNNNDGANENFSENYGVEGRTADGAIESIRKRQIKNFLLTLFISQGVPMLLGGDEFRRTQGGNNNAYCQDNETSWYDWDFLKQHKDIFNFTRGMIAFRRSHPILSQEQFYTDAQIQWFDPQGEPPNWTSPEAKKLACLIHEDKKRSLFFMFNASNDAVDFKLPPAIPGARRRLVVDTSHEIPQDLFAAGKGPLLENQQTYHLNPRSSAILLAFLVIFIFLVTPVQAQVINKATQLEKSRHSETNLEMKEAMAKTYTDIVREFNVVAPKKKEWLYSMVCLNMAYLQFGGSQGKYGSTTELNRLIRQKLIKYLPPDVLKKTGSLHTLE